MKHPQLYVIAGPNGAGKTTFAREFLPEFADCPNFVNADEIAKGISLEPDKAGIRAGKILLEEINILSLNKTDFGFETTLSGTNYLNRFQELKRRGYIIHLIYLWLPSVEMAIQRVKDRVKLGGHSIPEPVIRRRYERSILNFRYYRKVVNYWQVCDASTQPPAVLAYGSGEGSVSRDEKTEIKLKNLLEWYED